MMTGVALLLAGVAVGCWPRENVLARSRALVVTRTYDQRGPRVFVETRAGRVRDAGGQVLSVPMLLGADGYWARSGPEYITRERLQDTRVLVIDRLPEQLGNRRTTTLVSRWIESGGAVMVLTAGQGPEGTNGAWPGTSGGNRPFGVCRAGLCCASAGGHALARQIH